MVPTSPVLQPAVRAELVLGAQRLAVGAAVVGAGDPRARAPPARRPTRRPRARRSPSGADQPGLDAGGEAALGDAGSGHSSSAVSPAGGWAIVPSGEVSVMPQAWQTPTPAAPRTPPSARAGRPSRRWRRCAGAQMSRGLAVELGEQALPDGRDGGSVRGPLALDHLGERRGLEEAVRHQHADAGHEGGVRQAPGVRRGTCGTTGERGVAGRSAPSTRPC